jgi:uncharacterized protein (DUF2235 family)
VPADFVGVWDTVSSVGWFSNPISLPYTANNHDIAIGRHAVAIDERRTFFRSNLWQRSADAQQAGPKDMKQVWFPGVHCDVGGGYPDPESGLSKIALQWMIEEASQAGLILHANAVDLILGRRGLGYVRPNPDACLHNSLTPRWKPVEFVRKPHWNQNPARPSGGPIARDAAPGLQAPWCMTLPGNVATGSTPSVSRATQSD